MEDTPKRLYLIRHAKSDWGAPTGGDHERPLAKRGQKAAQLMGRFLTAIDQVPEAVLASTALRARTTAEQMAEAGGWDVEIATERSLYESHAERVLQEIRKQDDDAASLLVVGHEPTWSALVALLTGGSEVRMATATLVRIDSDVRSWKQWVASRGVLTWMVTPRLLQAAGWKGPT